MDDQRKDHMIQKEKKNTLKGTTLKLLDNKLSQNVQNITWSHKLYRENYENLESGINSKREKLSWNEDLKRYITRRCTITINNYDDATKPHIRKMHSQMQT